MTELGAIAFGDFHLDLASEGVSRAGRPIALTPKAYALLRHFLAHPGEELAKGHLLDALWPESAVSDTVLKVCVAELRKALDDDVAAPRYVATAHRRGYRFVAPVATVPRASALETRAVRTSGRVPHRVVGRVTALAELDAALAVARTGTRQMVFVTGEAGIGKTTLVETFLDEHEAGARHARGHCSAQYGAGEPYLPLLDALAGLCRDPAHADVLATLQRAAPTWIATLPGVTREPAAATPAAPTRARMLLELVEALETAAADAPFVLVLEDLHWSDYSTLDVLSLLARRSEPARLLEVRASAGAHVLDAAADVGARRLTLRVQHHHEGARRGMHRAVVPACRSSGRHAECR